MRGFFTIILIFLLFIPCPASASISLFGKKNYKQIFINDALNAEKRKNYKSAFHSYEKALYYYKKDENVIKSYASFCERQKYYDKAEELYKKLYTLTKNSEYLFKSNLCAIKNGNLTNAQVQKIIANSSYTAMQKTNLNSALVFHYSYQNEWGNVKKVCDQIPKNYLNTEVISTCLAASEKSKDKKNSLGYYIRYSELYPNNSSIVNKIINLSESLNHPDIQETFIKKLSTLNPKDKGIKYKLAGFYEKQGKWLAAAKVYEKLIASGDTNKHVKTSLAYVMSQINPPKQSAGTENPYRPKPLSGFKLHEKLFYENLDAKKYDNAQVYLNKMLKKEPQNIKLLKHKVDIAAVQENFKEAIEYMEKIDFIKPLSDEDKRYLAYLYSKTNNYDKALEIAKSLIEKSPKDKKALSLALEYSMAQKNWDEAIVYNSKLLEFEPKSEQLLKTIADLYATKNDFANATIYYEKLVEFYPDIKYKFALTNMYMANQNFAKAQSTIEPIYQASEKNPLITDLYLNTLLAQNKIAQAYWVIKNNNLEQTKEGYMVMGDMFMLDKNYKLANKYYATALNMVPDNLVLKNKLAESYRMMGHIEAPTQLFNQVLAQDPENLQAQLGLGSLEIDKKNYKKARSVFYKILDKNPNYRPAEIAIAQSFISSDDKMNAIEILNNISPDKETKLMKAQTYYDMNMFSNAKTALKGLISDDAGDLRYKIKRDNALTITPSYTLFLQQLANEFNLDYYKFGLNVSENIKKNTNVFMDYNVYVYSSGAQYYYTNVVNEFIVGATGRPVEKWEYRADLGVKAFQFGGAMLNTDSWIKHYFNDRFNLKLGFQRNNIEQSYMSAVGEPINGVFTGRSAYNKLYLEYEKKLPRQFYSFGRSAYGLIYSSNMETNQYWEFMLGAGKLLYNNPKNKWINKFLADIVTYNMGYQYNQLEYYTSSGELFGGYFSPSYFNATTLNLKAEGNIKKWGLKYGVKGFGGIQTAITPDKITPTWGYSPYITYDISDNVSINASYNHFDYADLKRDIFMFSAVIRFF